MSVQGKIIFILTVVIYPCMIQLYLILNTG